MGNFPKWVDTLKAIVGVAFVIFGVWDYISPVDKETILQLITLLAAVIGGLIGIPPVIRLARGLILVRNKALDLPVNFYKWVDTVKAAVGLAFVLFAVWNFNSPVNQETIIALIDLLAVVIGGFFSLAALLRKLSGVYLIKTAAA